MPVYLALPIAVAIGALVGVFNGVLVTRLKIPSFIVTLGSYNLLYGISLWITHTSTFNPTYPPPGANVSPSELDFFTGLTASFGQHPISLEVLWMVVLAIAVGLLLHRSLFGFRLMAIGGNPVAAKLARLPVAKYKILAFMLCGMLAADRRHPRFLVHPDRAAEQRPLLHLPGLRRRHHRRGEPHRRQGHDHRDDRRGAAPRRTAAGPGAPQPRARMCSSSSSASSPSAPSRSTWR